MSINDTTIEKRFPKPTLTVIVGTPTYATIARLCKEVNSNAMKVPSVRGSGDHGHLAITIEDARYRALTGVDFDAPANPGKAVDHQANATAPQIIENNRFFDAATREFQLFNTVQDLLKRQILDAVDAMYLDDLNDENVGFATVTCRQILSHLRMHYGSITPDELDDNLVELDRQWQPPAPLEALFQQIKQCRCIAVEGHDPITDKTAVRAALKNVEATGLFSEACRDWRKKPVAQQTMHAFKQDFSLADKERQRTTTSASAGFHGANAVSSITTPAPSTPNYRASAAPASTTQNRSASIPKTIHYCWTHGLGRNPRHTSPKCRNPAENHCKEATLYNMMGGCRRIHQEQTTDQN